MAITTNGGAGVTADAVATLSNKTLEAPVINNATFTGAQAGLEIKFGNNIVLEGTTDNAFEMTLSGGDPTADRTITLPDVTTTVVGTDATQTLTNKTLALGSNTVTGTIAQFNTSVTDADFATLAGSETLTNKTITSPIVSGLTLSDGSIVLEGATADAFETTLTVTDPTADRTITFPDSSGTVALTSDITVTASSTTTLTNKSISLSTNTVTTTLAELNTAISDADIVSLAGSETLTNKTLTSPTINTATFKDGVIRGLEEDVNVVASAATGTINFDVDTASVWYYTSNATANHTLNFRYSSSVSLNSALATGDSITLVWLNTNGATAYYPNAITIDGNAVTPKVPAAITAGNASSIDVYSFTIIKTASATFTVLETQQKFA